MPQKELLQRYAELIVSHGLNVQSDQLVNIGAEVSHRELVLEVAAAAYRRGAKHVQVDYIDTEITRTRILEGSRKHLSFVPAFVSQKYGELVDAKAANLRIIGPENPDTLSDLSPDDINTIRLNQHLAVKRFYDEGIGKQLVHWTVVAASTPGWAAKVFPNLPREEACEKLWSEIFAACRVDRPDFLELWKEHNLKLQSRSKRLNELKISRLEFRGPDTELDVFLHPKARFRGGSDKGPYGVEFEPNLPTEEVFTTPDARKTKGHARVTRPVMINGKLIKDLNVYFEAGKLIKFTASDGEETFRAYVSSDEGASRLGEVALVGIDSPIFKSGIVFQEILFDENAACHIAVGSAYRFCIDGGTEMTKEEAQAVGCNESTVHADLMISSEEVSVTAVLEDGLRLELISDGAWAAGWV